MNPFKKFQDLVDYLATVNQRKKIAVANAVDSHTLEAVLMAVRAGVVEAYLIGDVVVLESKLEEEIDIIPYIHIVDIPDPKEAAIEAVRMVREGECDILMKGLVNTDVLLRAILDKEKGIVTPGSVLSYNAALEIPAYSKLLFFTDPAVIPEPSLQQRVQMIKYTIKTALSFGVKCPKVALIHATEVANPKIRFMEDYQEVMNLWRQGEFGDVIMDGPIDIFLALNEEMGSIKNIKSPICGDADVVIFPDFQSANVFYKGLAALGGAEMAGLLHGAQSPVVMTSRSDSSRSKFMSICMACVLC